MIREIDRDQYGLEGEHFSPNDFFEDNLSPQAESNRNAFYAILKNGQLYFVRRCSDARGNIPEENCIDISNIATDGPQEPYKDLMIYDGVQAIVELVHYDGKIFRPGHFPEGCGGLKAKEEQLASASSRDIKRFGLPRYVEAIKSPDPVVLAYYNAESIASHTHKPVLAAIQEHISGIIFPLATFQNEEGEITCRTKIPTRYMLQGQYDQRVIYQNGIPTLNEGNIPEVFQTFLELNRKQISGLEEEYPNLHEMLQIQNPKFAIITTEKISARLRYPSLLKEPGSYFQVHIPRDKYEQVIFIDQRTIDTAIEQVQYPVEHFSKIDTILIETGDLTQSKRIGSSLEKTDWMQKWKARRPNHQIFTGETRAGKLVRLEEFK